MGADDNGYVGRTVEDIKAQVASKLEEAARLLATANALEDMIGMPRTSLGDFIGDDAGDSLSILQVSSAATSSQTQQTAPRSTGRSIKPDQFLGEPPLDAAKKYLGMVGHATHLDQIVDAVQRGGAATKGADWKDRLEMSLLRSVHDVVKVQEKTFGLISFYTPEQIKGLRGTRRNADRPKPKKRVRKTTRRATEKTAEAGPKAAPQKKAAASPAGEPAAAKKVEASEQVH